MPLNTLLIGDTVHALTAPYRNGARAMRMKTSFRANPHRPESQAHADWAAGHENEAAGIHRVDRIDVIDSRNIGLEFVVSPEALALESAP